MSYFDKWKVFKVKNLLLKCVFNEKIFRTYVTIWYLLKGYFILPQGGGGPWGGGRGCDVVGGIVRP